jgi:hypothetical protein
MKDCDLKIVLEAILNQLEAVASGQAPNREIIEMARKLING